MTPPLTGASRKSTCIFWRVLPISIADFDEIVLISITTVPGLRYEFIPVRSLKTFSTSFVSGKIEIIKLLFAIPLKLLTDFILSFSNFFVILGLMSYTLTSYPCFIKFFNIGKPILPAPIKPID